ncbi:MAG TPA: VOC family protein [Terriglobales bacterium]|nr:VOC family protein [Terriglobales bacterium]
MRLNFHLHFSGECEEAFKFYEKHLGCKIEGLFRYEDAPPEAQNVPADWRKKIMHAYMTIGDQILMGMDAPPGHFEKPQGFHVNIGVKDVDTGKKIFEALSERGNVIMNFGPTFWSSGFAMFVDRFGIPWMVNVELAAQVRDESAA